MTIAVIYVRDWVLWKNLLKYLIHILSLTYLLISFTFINLLRDYEIPSTDEEQGWKFARIYRYCPQKKIDRQSCHHCLRFERFEFEAALMELEEMESMNSKHYKKYFNTVKGSLKKEEKVNGVPVPHLYPEIAPNSECRTWGRRRYEESLQLLNQRSGRGVSKLATELSRKIKEKTQKRN